MHVFPMLASTFNAAKCVWWSRLLLQTPTLVTSLGCVGKLFRSCPSRKPMLCLQVLPSVLQSVVGGVEVLRVCGQPLLRIVKKERAPNAGLLGKKFSAFLVS